MCVCVLLSIYLSVCLSIFLSIFLSFFFSFVLSFFLSFFLSVFLSFFRSFFLSIYSYIWLFICVLIIYSRIYPGSDYVPSALYLFSFQATEALSQLPLHALDLELVQDVASKWQFPSKIHVAQCCTYTIPQWMLHLAAYEVPASAKYAVF